VRKTTKIKFPAPAAWPTKDDTAEGLRVALYSWWHKSRALLGKVMTEANQMAQEIADKPDGPLAGLVNEGKLRSLGDAVENVITGFLHEVEIAGACHVHAPSEKMYDTARRRTHRPETVA